MTAPPENGRHINTNDLIEDLKGVADTVDGALTKREYDEHGTYSPAAVIDRFDSWNNMKDDLGLAVSSPGRTDGEDVQIPTDDLLADLRAVAEEAGDQHRVDKDYYENHGTYSLSAYVDRFGSWNDAKQAADLAPQHIPPISADGCVDSVSVVAERVDGNLTCEAYDEHKRPIDPSSVTVINRVGSWSEAKERAGAAQSPKEITPEVIVEDIKRVADSVDESLTLTEFADHVEYSAQTVRRKLGSWTEAKDRAGVE
ncbi:homing endonuclease associated repeat-containing protein [Halovenus sp. HT40]|uniref:homing endonuclease associated repeat-containing protein n=1 Tax=Halovenus sp. HT40 TaxID=3126691 RepID=UPI00300EA4DF